MSDAAVPVPEHEGLDILDPDECWELLAKTPVGRVAFARGGGIEVIPVSYRLVGRQIVFMSPPGGTLTAARMASAVAFEVDEWDATNRRGWSVLAHGVAESAPESLAGVDLSTFEPWLRDAGDGTWIAILVEEISGRRLA